MKLNALLATLYIFMHHHLVICMEHGNLNTIDCSLMLLSQQCGFGDHVVELSKTTDVAAQDRVGKTRLHYATMLQNIDIVQLLLSEQTGKSLVAIQDIDGNTPLHVFFDSMARTFDFDEEKILKMLTVLLQSGFDSTLKNKKGDTIVHFAIKNLFNQTYLKIQPQIFKTLVEHGICLDVTNNEGETPLHCIFSSGTSSTELCSVFLALGATPDPKNNLGETPLHYAVMHREYEEQNYPSRINAIKALCAHKADPNCLTDDLETPLHYALKTHDYNAANKASESRLTMVPILLELGANPNAQNRFGVSPLCALMHSSHTEQKQAIARDMLGKYDANPNLKNKAGFTCLHTAVCTQQLPWVQLLLEHKATDVTLVHEPMLARAPTLQYQRKTALDIALEMQTHQQNQQAADTQLPKAINRTTTVQFNTLKNSTNVIDEIVGLLKKHTPESKEEDPKNE